MPPARQPLAERFWRKVNKNESCWLWTGAKHHFGYGVFRVEIGRQVVSHRMAWELTYGSIPEGLHVCHHCDNPPCVRPDHLFLGTDLDNMRDAAQKGRIPSGERHPWNVHPELVRHGTDHAMVKLSDDEVREIRRLYVPYHVTHKQLAEQFHVCEETIRLIVIGKTWRHLKD